MSSSQPSVLILDPDVDSRTILSVLLEHEGCMVWACEDAEEALEITRRVAPRIIVTEFPMPTSAHRTFVQAVRALRSAAQPHVIVCTAYALPFIEEQARRAGAERFIGKPVTPSALVLEILLHEGAGIWPRPGSPWRRRPGRGTEIEEDRKPVP